MPRRNQVIVGLFILALLTAVPVLAQDAPEAGGDTLPLPDGVAQLPFAMTQQEPIDTQDDGFGSAIPIACGAGGFGRIDPAGDTDYWRFILPAEEAIVARVYAMEGGSPLDATLRLFVNLGTGPGTVEVATNDDSTGATRACTPPVTRPAVLPTSRCAPTVTTPAAPVTGTSSSGIIRPT